jgi:hypothetical protein
MNAQRQLDVDRIKDYKTLTLELCDVYVPASKTAIADYIGISQKTIYNMLYGEVVGVYTKKKLAAFLLKEFGYQVKNLKDDNIKLVPASVNISGNTISKSSVAGRDIYGSDKQVDFLKNYIELLEAENKRLKEQLK